MRPGSGSSWWDRVSVQETALMALTVVFGLQMLRVLLNGLVFYIRDSLGAGSFIPGGYALVLFLCAFLAVPAVRVLGRDRVLILTAAGLALMRLAEQFVPWPVVDLALTTVGVLLFLWFIPVYAGRLRGREARGGQAFALGLLLGIAVDTAIKGTFSTLDMSWQPGVTTFLIVVFLVTGHTLLLRLVLSLTNTDTFSTPTPGRFVRAPFDFAQGERVEPYPGFQGVEPLGGGLGVPPQRKPSGRGGRERMHRYLADRPLVSGHPRDAVVHQVLKAGIW